MKIHATNLAYIDGANLYKGVEELGWKLDYKRFRTWLYEKYKVKKAFIFIGMIPKYKNIYTDLQECGFTLVFKEVVYDDKTGKPKGNCDADLVLRAARDTYESDFGKTIIVASDGDYASLVEFLKEKGKLGTILSPNKPEKCSILLKRTGAPISYLDDQRALLRTR
ncbi:MAG: hypothetical protein UY26_C0003G0203 [Candidatus Jorgensenbacteria bacterium GW2011_GWA1_48_13]|uniref:NYN domain-containing protein n=2 Tax=Candidatus Joergenseniibacteriota TaxID=1752739 RepID=A0A0G1W8W2_9BACT|nr:MAG: hypothetical protein UY26_C0003G0203 [Candidatus Jorgensenbacteria bacterium GW2011_GWA1_48_13]KKU98927.1 MAG: hypothetical protein UY32_C0011G0012 [Candidatus Jorgensenbacteria bacterium GW2011_GWC1_48_8]KKW15158.1 MAG: hypothetical protein UY55_C0002G0216 [Candidatus Jorgensenbacteria bacterium GW2011_GWB1_50_10]